MAITFRRKVKILPGIYLNISKKGVSTTIGPRGASISLGKKGAYLNTGIPGTGLSYRQKLFVGNNNNPDIPSDIDENSPLPETDESNDDKQDILTSNGLKGLKESLDESKQQRAIIATEIQETKDKLLELEIELAKKQNGFLARLFTKRETIENLESEINETNDHLELQKKEFEESAADVDIQMDEDIEQEFEKLTKSFDELIKCKKIWDITTELENIEIKSSAKVTIERTDVAFKPSNIDFIKSKHAAFNLANANGSQLFIYPAFVLLLDKTGKITLIDLKELSFKFRRQRFIEEKETIPSDTKIVGYSWAKVNKDGSPDMRFKGNYQIPVVHYGSLNFISDSGLNETYYISNPEIAENFANEFMSYLLLLKNDVEEFDTPNITKTYFDTLKEFADRFIAFINKIKGDPQFINFINQSPTMKQQTFKTPIEMIDFCFMFDITKSFSITNNIINLKSKEAFALIYLIAKKKGLGLSSYADIYLLFDENLQNACQDLFTDLKKGIDEQTEADVFFRLSLIIETYNEQWQKEYLTNLYHFASIVVKADGTVTKAEEESLKKILEISDKKKSKTSNENVQSEAIKSAIQPKAQTLDQALTELNSLIGLSAVKKEISSLVNFIKVQKAREAAGLQSSSLSYHIVFTGNPGTGKTTVARIISEIYKNLGVLTQGQLVEVDRSDLVAEYAGQTAVKVNKTVDSALNGILFIDEAYSLVGDNQDNFGEEAVSILIKRMEDNRDRLVVILAGYPTKMQEFLDKNPGFKSRINRYIEFLDYKPEELLAIFKLQCKKLDYSLTGDAEKSLTSIFTTAFLTRDKSFGNGRFVRNTFEKILEKHANRISSIPVLSKEILTTITVDDI